MFVHLHNHFTGSYSDSCLRIDTALDRVKALGQPGIAITDHGSVAKIYEFYYKSKLRGLKPILGCECYFVDNAKYNIANNINQRYHIVLLASDNDGLQNLIKIVNYSWTNNCFQNRIGFIDWSLLEKYHTGLILTTACLFGRVQQEYLNNGMDAAEEIVKHFLDIFGEDFYLELSEHGLPDEDKTNTAQIILAKKFGIHPVVTNDVHYLYPDDWRIHDMVIKTRFGRATDFKLDSRQYWLKSEDEMKKSALPQEYLNNTMEIFDKIDVNIKNIPIKKIFDCFALNEKMITQPKAKKIVSDLTGSENEEFESKLIGLPRGAGPDFKNLIECPTVLLPIRTLYNLPFSQIYGDYLNRIFDAPVFRKSEKIATQLFAQEKLLVYFYMTNNMEKSYAVIEKFSRNFTDVHSFFFAGIICYRLGYKKESTAFFHEYIEKQGNKRRHSRAYYFLGYLTDDYKYFIAGIIANSYYEMNYYGLGVTLFHLKKYNAAKAYLSFFIKNTTNTNKKSKAEYLLSQLSEI